MPDLGIASALLALGLILIPLVLLLKEELKLSGKLLLSMARAILQLIVLAYLLSIAFSAAVPWITALVLGLLLAISCRLLANRLPVDLPGLGPWILGALLISTGLVLSYVVVIVIHPQPWFAPQFWIPLGSALLANNISMGGTAAEQLLRNLQRNRQEIETHLSVGATPKQAIKAYRQSAIRGALLPTLQTVAIAGLGNLPLFLSGQLIAGGDPLVAVIYELVLILMLLSSGAIAVAVLCAGIERLSFTSLGQLKEP